MDENVPPEPGAKVVHLSEIPTGENFVVQDSSFFQRGAVSLPSPDEVRRKNIDINGADAAGSRPPPVPFEELGLIVKYGSDITTAEGQCLWYFNKCVKEEVPTPELFGWRRDNGETFIYMQLIHGRTMEEAWPSLGQEERDSICKELRGYVKAWQGLRQEAEPYFIGKPKRSCIVRCNSRLKVNLTVERSYRTARSRRHHLYRRHGPQSGPLRRRNGVSRLLCTLFKPAATRVESSPGVS